MENDHVQWVNPLFLSISMVIFNSYVSHYQRVSHHFQIQTTNMWRSIPGSSPGGRKPIFGRQIISCSLVFAFKHHTDSTLFFPLGGDHSSTKPHLEVSYHGRYPNNSSVLIGMFHHESSSDKGVPPHLWPLTMINGFIS